jgi:CheY-like chemotaxis protein
MPDIQAVNQFVNMDLSTRLFPGASCAEQIPPGTGFAVVDRGRKFFILFRLAMKCILVVDDETVVADSLCGILRINGFCAYAVTHAQEAYAVVEVLKPDLILLDVVLQDTRGLEAAIHLRDRLKQNVILMSGMAEVSEWLDQARKDGIREFTILAKPMDPRELVKFLRKELGIDKAAGNGCPTCNRGVAARAPD